MNKTSLWVPISLIAVGILVMIAVPYTTNPWVNVVVGMLCLFFGFVFLLLIVKDPQITKDSSLTKYHKFDVTISSIGAPTGYEGYDGVLQESDLINNFSRLSWQNAEDLVGLLFQKKGYHVKVTQRTGDFGIDVEATNGAEFIGIQVKHWASNVDYPSIAQTCGGGNRFTKVIFVSTKSGFTSASIKFANKDENRYRLELWNGQRFKQELRQFVIER